MDASPGCSSEYTQDEHRAHFHNPATEPIIEAATKFLWDDMKETLESFCVNHAHLFAGVVDPLGEGGLARNRAAETALRDALGVGPATGPLGDPAGGGLGAFRSAKAPDAEGEQRLEWTQAHLDFQQLFEQVLEVFIATQPFSTGRLATFNDCTRSITVVLHWSIVGQLTRNGRPGCTEDFVAACQDALDHGSWSHCRRMAEAILAMPDYNNFVRMMAEAAQQLALQVEQHEGGAE